MPDPTVVPELYPTMTAVVTVQNLQRTHVRSRILGGEGPERVVSLTVASADVSVVLLDEIRHVRALLLVLLDQIDRHFLADSDARVDAEIDRLLDRIQTLVGFPVRLTRREQ
jgi:hypothetical protein